MPVDGNGNKTAHSQQGLGNVTRGISGAEDEVMQAPIEQQSPETSSNNCAKNNVLGLHSLPSVSCGSPSTVCH